MYIKKALVAFSCNSPNGSYERLMFAKLFRKGKFIIEIYVVRHKSQLKMVLLTFLPYSKCNACFTVSM